MDRAFYVYVTTLAAFTGAGAGSFVNCMAWRMVHGGSALSGRSRCPFCGHKLGARDLLPVFSYAASAGRCRYCGKKISIRYFLTEILMAVVFAGLFLHYQWKWETLCYMGLSCILLGISLVDLETYRIPRKFLWAAVLWWLVFLPFLTKGVFSEAFRGLAGALFLGGTLLSAVLLMDRILGKESMGGGDVKLYAVTGLYVGIGRGVFLLLLSCVLGLFYCILKRKSRIPLAPSISLACIATLFWGEAVVDWYLGFILAGGMLV